jgi:PAS domain S-box-containing protein
MEKYSNLEELSFLTESALESSLAGYWDWNMVTNEEYLSPRFKEMFGYEDHEMINAPESWEKIAYQEDLPGMMQSFDNHVISKGEIPFKSIVRYHHKNGSTVWVRCNGKVVKWGENGEPLRAIGCHVDITEERELQIQLQKTISERDFFLKEVHHRVKNNLQLLLSISRLKTKNGLIETHEIEDSISSIARAYEAIYQAEQVQSISIENYLNQIIKPIISGRNIDFNIQAVQVNKGIDFLIPIGLIITELVNNSLKHAFENLAENKICLEIDTANNQLLIKYCDNGKGFGKDFLAQLDTCDSFGISIMQGLIDQLNGEIKFYDKEGAIVEIVIDLGEK